MLSFIATAMRRFRRSSCALRTTAETVRVPAVEQVEGRVLLSVSSAAVNALVRLPGVDATDIVVDKTVSNGALIAKFRKLKQDGFLVATVTTGDGRAVKAADKAGLKVIATDSMTKSDKKVLFSLRKIVDGVSIDNMTLTHSVPALKSELVWIGKVLNKPKAIKTGTVACRNIANLKTDWLAPVDSVWASYAISTGSTPVDPSLVDMSVFTKSILHSYNWLHQYDHSKGVGKPIVFTLKWPTSSSGTQRATPEDQAAFLSGVAKLGVPFVVSQAYDSVATTRTSSDLQWGVKAPAISALRSAGFFSTKKIPAKFSAKF